MTVTKCFAEVAILTIKNDMLHVYIADGKLPSGEVDPEVDRNFAFAARRIAEGCVGEVPLQLKSVETFSGTRGTQSAAGEWNVQDLYTVFLRPEHLSDDAISDFLPVEVAKDIITPTSQESLNRCVTELSQLSHRSKWPMFLLNKEFTLTEMRRAYEIVSGYEIVDSAFRRKVLSMHIVSEVGERRGLQTRPATTYQMMGVLMNFEKNLVYTQKT